MPARLLLLSLCLAPLLLGCATAVVTGGTAAVAVVHDRRSTGTVIEDQEIELKVFNHIQKNNELKKFSDISTTSFNRRVLLTGAAATPAIAQQVASYAKGVRNVREVINEIEIHPEYDGDVKSTINDAYINTQAKLALFQVKLPGFDPTRINVTTYNGSVYLMGMVSQTEGSAAAEKVRYVSNVKRVVKHFEYVTVAIDPNPRPSSSGSGNLDAFH